MEVILVKPVSKLGQIGDVLSVKSGYARNFLIPQGHALRATKENKKIFEERRSQLEARNLESKKEAEAVASKLKDYVAVIARSASEAGQLYGSVKAQDIAQAISNDIVCERSQIVMDKPYKQLGVYSQTISLHPEVRIEILVNVCRTVEEAEGQLKKFLKGDDIADKNAGSELEETLKKLDEEESADVAKVATDASEDAKEEAGSSETSSVKE